MKPTVFYYVITSLYFFHRARKGIFRQDDQVVFCEESHTGVQRHEGP